MVITVAMLLLSTHHTQERNKPVGWYSEFLSFPCKVRAIPKESKVHVSVSCSAVARSRTTRAAVEDGSGGQPGNPCSFPSSRDALETGAQTMSMATPLGKREKKSATTTPDSEESISGNQVLSFWRGLQSETQRDYSCPHHNIYKSQCPDHPRELTADLATSIMQQGRPSTGTTNTAPLQTRAQVWREDPQFQLRHRGRQCLSEGSGSKAPHFCSHWHFCSTTQHPVKVHGMNLAVWLCAKHTMEGREKKRITTPNIPLTLTRGAFSQPQHQG